MQVTRALLPVRMLEIELYHICLPFGRGKSGFEISVDSYKMRKFLLTYYVWAKIPLGEWKDYVIGEWGSSACAHVTPITVWIVSKNESNCLLEQKDDINLLVETCQITVLYSVKHSMAYHLVIFPLPSITDVTSCVQSKFLFSFCCTSKPKTSSN